MNPYVDEKTGAHFNKLGISSRDDLHLVEYAVTDLRIAQLQVEPIKGDFDLEHLKAVHKHIFQDLYEWAGKPRTVNFSKRDPTQTNWTSPFAPHDKIEAIAESITTDLKAWNYLKGMNRDDFAAGMTSTYVKLNYMHPFPEGNGRSTQTFIAQLAREAGYELNFAKVDKEEWNHAAARSMPQRNVDDRSVTRKPDAAMIHEVFRKIVEPIRERRRAPEHDR